MDHMSTRMMFHEELAPGPICSIGSIIGNLKQREEPFHFVGGDDEDLGLNLTFVAPSGMSKSYSMNQFLNRNKGICPLRSTFRGKITEAGFVGTITGEGEERPGDAFNYAEGILAFNEITNLFYAQQQDHSAELVNQVMEALSERKVSKRLANGTLDYPTYVTIWGGVQPRRFDFSQGLGRRFLFISRQWSDQDIQKLMDSRMERRRVKAVNMNEVSAFRNELADAVKVFNAQEVVWEEGLLKFIKQMCESHLQMQLLEKAIIGREIIDQYESSTIVIRNNKDNRDLLTMFLRMLQMVAEGSDVSLMVSIINELSGGKPVRLSELWERFRRFSYTLEGFEILKNTCIRLKVLNVAYKEGSQYLSLRKDLRR